MPDLPEYETLQEMSPSSIDIQLPTLSSDVSRCDFIALVGGPYCAQWVWFHWASVGVVGLKWRSI